MSLLKTYASSRLNELHQPIPTNNLSIKPFWPIILTFFVPRALSLIRTLRVAIRTRPQPTALPPRAQRALNILFFSITLFLALSLKPSLTSQPNDENIFITTGSRFNLSTDALFARLAIARASSAGGVLSEVDEALRSKLSSRAGREIYLRFGPSTLINCAFCDKDDRFSYVLYALPKLLAPHVFHFFILGAATSEGIAGFEVKRWRTWCLIGAVALAMADLWVSLAVEVKLDGNRAPLGVYWLLRSVRPLVLCLYDALVASVIWASLTNRLLLFGGKVDDEVVRRRNQEVLARGTLQLQTAQTKLRAANVVANSVVRDRVLRGVEDEYWREVREVEGREGLANGMEGVWQDEEVQSAMARAYGQGSIDVGRMRKEAEGFVRAVTGQVDQSGST